MSWNCSVQCTPSCLCGICACCGQPPRYRVHGGCSLAWWLLILAHNTTWMELSLFNAFSSLVRFCAHSCKLCSLQYNHLSCPARQPHPNPAVLMPALVLQLLSQLHLACVNAPCVVLLLQQHQTALCVPVHPGANCPGSPVHCRLQQHTARLRGLLC